MFNWIFLLVLCLMFLLLGKRTSVPEKVIGNLSKVEPFERLTFADEPINKIIYDDQTMPPQCRCRKYLDPPVGLNTCKTYLEDLLYEYPTASQSTKNEFINWCHSYRRRLFMFPQFDLAKEWFLRFHKHNQKTGS